MSVNKKDMKRKRTQSDAALNAPEKSQKIRKLKVEKKSSAKDKDSTLSVALDIQGFSKNQVLQLLIQNFDDIAKFRNALKQALRGPFKKSPYHFYHAFIGHSHYVRLEEKTIFHQALEKQNWPVMDHCLKTFLEFTEKISSKTYKHLTLPLLRTHLACISIRTPTISNAAFEAYVKHYEITFNIDVPEIEGEEEGERQVAMGKTTRNIFPRDAKINPCKLLFENIKLKADKEYYPNKTNISLKRTKWRNAPTLKSSQVESRLKTILANKGSFDQKFFKAFLSNELEYVHVLKAERYINLLKIFLQNPDYLGPMEGILDFAYDNNCSKETIICLEKQDPSFVQKTTKEKRLLFYARYGFIKEWQELWHTMQNCTPETLITLRSKQLQAIVSSTHFNKDSMEVLKKLISQEPPSEVSQSGDWTETLSKEWCAVEDVDTFAGYLFQEKYPYEKMNSLEHFYKSLHRATDDVKLAIVDVMKTWAIKSKFFERTTPNEILLNFFYLLLDSIKNSTVKLFLKPSAGFDLIKEMTQQDFLLLRLISAYATGLNEFNSNLEPGVENADLNHWIKNFVTIINSYLNAEGTAHLRFEILFRSFIQIASFPEKPLNIDNLKPFFAIFTDEHYKTYLTPQLFDDMLHSLCLDYPNKNSVRTTEIIEILESFGANIQSLNKNKLNILQQHILSSKSNINTPDYEAWESEDLALTKYFLKRKINHDATVLQNGIEQTIFDIIVEGQADDPRAFQTHMAYLCGQEEYRPLIHAAHERLQLRMQKEGRLKVIALHDMAQNVHADALHQSASECGRAIFDKYLCDKDEKEEGEQKNENEKRHKKIVEKIQLFQNFVFQELKQKIFQVCSQKFQITEQEWNTDPWWIALYDFNLRVSHNYLHCAPWSAPFWGLPEFQAYRWLTITRINYQRVPKDKISQLGIDEILAAVILASEDPDVFKNQEEINASFRILSTHLSELQVEYVKKDQADLTVADDQPACPGGSFPKIVSALDRRHPLVKLYTIGGSNLITFITNFFDMKFNALNPSLQDQLILEIVGKDSDHRDRRWHLGRDETMEFEDSLTQESFLSRFVKEVHSEFYKEENAAYAISRKILTEDRIEPWFNQPFPLNQFKDISKHYLHGVMGQFYDAKFQSLPALDAEAVLKHCQNNVPKSFLEQFKEEFLNLPIIKVLTSSNSPVYPAEDIERYCFKNALPLHKCPKIKQSVAVYHAKKALLSDDVQKMDESDDVSGTQSSLICF